MDETEQPDLASELRQLGNNLKASLQSAWESEERKKVQEDIEHGLTDLGQLLQDAARPSLSPTGSGRRSKQTSRIFAAGWKAARWKPACGKICSQPCK